MGGGVEGIDQQWVSYTAGLYRRDRGEDRDEMGIIIIIAIIIGFAVLLLEAVEGVR